MDGRESMAATRIGSIAPGRFRSLGDGQIDFKAIFSKMAQYDYPGWAVLEWECCIKHPKAGAAEGAALIKQWIIRVTDKAFDDFAGAGARRRTRIARSWDFAEPKHVTVREARSGVCLDADSCRAIDLGDVAHIAQAFFAGRLRFVPILNAMGEVLGLRLKVRRIAGGVGLVESWCRSIRRADADLRRRMPCPPAAIPLIRRRGSIPPCLRRRWWCNWRRCRKESA